MTIDSRPGPHLVDMLRRLRARPVSSWGVGDRESVMRAALQRLAELAAAAPEGAVVPDVGLCALPDQLAVLVADAQSSEVPPAELDAVLTDLARALSV
jgi:hypothetical protein